jgi:aryl-alcohol dehydrogenase-like predicted oxidoreductase
MRSGEDTKRLVEMEAEESEKHVDEPMLHGLRRGGTRKQVYSIRLAPEQVAEIEKLAEAAGVPPSGLVRNWVLEALSAHQPDSLREAVAALERDVDRLKRQLAS